MLPGLLEGLRVAREGRGRPRTRPDALLGDKAYCSKAHRDMLIGRGIKVVIPQRADQIANRKRRGRKGGRPPGFDEQAYKGRNVVERAFCAVKQWRGVATRYDKHVVNYRAAIVMFSALDWLDLIIGDTP